MRRIFGGLCEWPGWIKASKMNGFLLGDNKIKQSRAKEEDSLSFDRRVIVSVVNVLSFVIYLLIVVDFVY